MNPPSRHFAWLAVAAVAGITACTSAEEEPAAQQSAGGFAEHMHGHLDQVSAIKSAVIAGDLEAARAPAVWLSEHEEPAGMPDGWSPYLWEMRQYAATAAAARDLQTAAVAVSEIARTCGECHRANGLDVAFGYDQRPPVEPQDITTQMQRHLWAADRLWESLLGPSDAAWTSGTNILAEVNLAPEQVDDTTTRAPEVDDLVQRIRSLGRDGGLTPAGPARSQLYGEFLSLCASCHTLTGGGPASLGGARAARP